MKITFNEYADFFIELEAETVSDAAMIARMGIMSTQKATCNAFANSSGTVTAQISIGKKKFKTGEIK